MTPDSKTCHTCGREKPFDDFCAGAGRFGLSTVCKPCQIAHQKAYRRANRAKTLKFQRDYNRSFCGKVMMCYHNMRGRVFGIQKEKAHLYRGLGLMGRKNFYMWALTDHAYKRLFAAWVKSGYVRSLTPSVNRVDTKKGYVAGNIEFVTHGENSRLGARRKVYGRTQ